MIFLVDTNICSAELRGHPGVHQKLRQYAGEVAISTICAGEFRAWGLRRSAPSNRAVLIVRFLSTLTLLPIDDVVSRRFAELHAGLLDQGRPTPTLDLLIAATAIEHGLTLVTNNSRDFAHISALALEDWLSR